MLLSINYEEIHLFVSGLIFEAYGVSDNEQCVVGESVYVYCVYATQTHLSPCDVLWLFLLWMSRHVPSPHFPLIQFVEYEIWFSSRSVFAWLKKKKKRLITLLVIKLISGQRCACVIFICFLSILLLHVFFCFFSSWWSELRWPISAKDINKLKTPQRIRKKQEKNTGNQITQQQKEKTQKRKSVTEKKATNSESTTAKPTPQQALGQQNQQCKRITWGVDQNTKIPIKKKNNNATSPIM